MSADTILGISPGTRSMGIAVLRDGIILEAQVHSFPGTWSKTKLRRILNLVLANIHRYDVAIIAVKLPDTLPLSKGFHQVIGSINVLGERKEVHIRYYSLSDIKKYHCPEEAQTKEVLMERLVAIHSELTIEYRRERKNRNKYYYKLFEAVAAAMMQ